ncbi:RsiV family protein [Anaerovibrio sp.]|uniref:RsiV family protein n=1 Tax=Anaerovibrio sp. TaxID=1872532 RepID=UPI003890129F
MNIKRIFFSFLLGITMLTTGFMAVGEAATEIFVDASIKPVQLYVTTKTAVDSDEEGEVLHSSIATVDMVDSGQALGVEALKKALNNYNTQELKKYEDIRAGMIKEATGEKVMRKEGGSTFFPVYEATKKVYIRRSDTMAVSLLEFCHSYEGGVHGMYGVWGRNFDAQSGKELKLKDVIKDKSLLIAAVENQLRRDYPNASFMESNSTLMQETVEKMIKDDVIPWTLDPWGITVYFNPYAIGSYAEGMFTSTIFMDEFPELFKLKYRKRPASYCMELYTYMPVRTLFPDGSGSSLCINDVDDGIVVQSGPYSIKDEKKSMDIRSQLICLADGRRYIYVDGVDEGQVWERTRIYDITSSAPVAVPLYQWLTRRGDIPNNFIQIKEYKNSECIFYPIADPDSFAMTNLDMDSGDVGFLYYRIGEDGRPVLK